MGHGKVHPAGKVPNTMNPHSRMSQTVVESMMGGGSNVPGPPVNPQSLQPMPDYEKPAKVSGFRVASERRKMGAGKIKGGGY